MKSTLKHYNSNLGEKPLKRNKTQEEFETELTSLIHGQKFIKKYDKEFPLYTFYYLDVQEDEYSFLIGLLTNYGDWEYFNLINYTSK